LLALADVILRGYTAQHDLPLFRSLARLAGGGFADQEELGGPESLEV